MKKLLVLFFVFIYLSGFAQSDYPVIRISNDIELIKISNNAYVHISYTYLPKYGRVSANGLILIDGKQAFLFDTPWNDSLTRILYSWITDSMHLKLAGFVPNHWHEDCLGGLSFLQKENIPSYANQKTIEIAQSHNLPSPANGFKDSLQLSLGDKIIKCYYFGAAHSLDNIVVWLPSEKILFAGCMAKSVTSNDLGNVADGDLNAYPKTIEKVIDKFPNAKTIIPGHGRFGGFELLLHTKKLSTR